MSEFFMVMISICAGVMLGLLGVLVGGWLVFKGKSTFPNETFTGRQTKGEVFNISTDDAEEFPGTEEPGPEEEHVLKKTATFLKSLRGGG